MTRRSIGERPKQPNASGMLGQMGGIDIYIYIYIIHTKYGCAYFYSFEGGRTRSAQPIRFAKLSIHLSISTYMFMDRCLFMYMYIVYVSHLCMCVCMFVCVIPTQNLKQTVKQRFWEMVLSCLLST